MSTLTYVKGLRTPIVQLRPLGFREMEMLLSAFAPIFRLAAIEQGKLFALEYRI
jgi:hypothetical protein